MFCPNCGNEMADNAKSCSHCGRHLGALDPRKGRAQVVKILIAFLALVLIGGAAYLELMKSKEDPNNPVFDFSQQWVTMDFMEFGIKLEVPGSGWHLDYNAQSEVVLRDSLHGELGLNFLRTTALNPDAYRVDNKPDVYSIVSQEPVFLKGFGFMGDTVYTVVGCKEGGIPVRKFQLYFKRVFKAETITYIITMSGRAGQDFQYEPIFQHVVESIDLYE